MGWFFLVLLVGLDLKLGKRPVIKSTYSGISLVSWLEWKGKTVKDIYMRQDMCGQGQGWSDWRTGQRQPERLDHGQTAKIHRNTHGYPTEFSSQLFPSECELCDDLQTVARFSHLWVFVWSAVRRRYSAICLMSVQVHHINIFVCANLEAHSGQPRGWMEEWKCLISCLKGQDFLVFTPAPESILHLRHRLFFPFTECIQIADVLSLGASLTKSSHTQKKFIHACVLIVQCVLSSRPQSKCALGNPVIVNHLAN